jgi:hypothetical protein
MPMNDSNIDKWNVWYRRLDPNNPGPFIYGDTVTLPMGAAFLNDVDLVEDWGCGSGNFKRYCRTRYRGIDGSDTPFADQKVDLCNYRSNAEGIYMRHVLEHNYAWKQLLTNAVESFQKKMVLVLFTPFAKQTGEIAHNAKLGVDVPDIAFRRKDIVECFAGCRWTSREDIKTATGYGIEHIFFLNKLKAPARSPWRRACRS